MIPDPTLGCHKSGMQMTCHEGVVKHRCQLWGSYILEENGQKKEYWGCIEMLKFIQNMNIERRINQLGGAIESLRNEQLQIIGAASLNAVERGVAEVQKYIHQGPSGPLLTDASDAKN